MSNKKLKRLPLPPSRNAVSNNLVEYVINNVSNNFEGMIVWYWTASPEIYSGQIHPGFESAERNAQKGYSKVFNGKITIQLFKPGAYMLKDKIIPPSIFYKIFIPNFGYTELQKIELK